MLGLSFASVPLYKIFCQQTGFGGTTQVAYEFPTWVANRKLKIEFNADTAKGLPWSFEPLQRSIETYAGEQAFAVYHVKNESDEPIVGMAVYNVSPAKAGPYFRKVECFCFLEQKLNAHQSIDMPLLFFIDPDIVNDPNLDDVNTITLSYTFFPFEGEIPEDPYGKS